MRLALLSLATLLLFGCADRRYDSDTVAWIDRMPITEETGPPSPAEDESEKPAKHVGFFHRPAAWAVVIVPLAVIAYKFATAEQGPQGGGNGEILNCNATSPAAPGCPR